MPAPCTVAAKVNATASNFDIQVQFIAVESGRTVSSSSEFYKPTVTRRRSNDRLSQAHSVGGAGRMVGPWRLERQTSTVSR